MSFPELEGRRAIVMVRCSTHDQPQSIQDQMDACHQFAQANGMTVVDVVRHEGVSASVAANLDAITDDLVDRKRRKDSFDCILVYDFSRFSRSGPRHASKMKWDLEQAGIDVITVMGYQPPNPFSDVADSFNAAQAREQARSIASSSARGAQSALEKGVRSHCTKPPYGVNRMILSESGEELFVLQNEVDGTQLRLDPTMGAVLERLPKKVGKASGHYKKSAGQRVVLVPGRPEHVDVVHQIYRRYEMDGWGCHRIAQELNDQSIPSGKGSVWHKKAVKDILNNSVYCGKGLANARTSALYYRRSNGAPIDQSAHGRRPGQRRLTEYRQPEDWVWIDEERMTDYLPTELRERAWPRQQQYLVDRAIGVHRTPSRDKHVGSPFILKDVLTTPDGTRMTGQRNKHRYYIHSRSHTAPKSNEIRPRVRAEAVEDPILAHLRMMLLCVPFLRPHVLERSHEWAEAREEGDGRQALEQRLESLNRKVSAVLAVDSDFGLLREQLNGIMQEKREIESRLNAKQGLPHLTSPEIEEVVDELLDNLQKLGQMMGTFDNTGLKKLVDVFVESAVYDHEAREVSVRLRVPSWAMVEDRMMGLGDPSDSKSIPEAYAFMGFQFEFQVPKMWREATPAWLMSSMPPGGSPPALLDAPRDNPSGPGTGTQAPDHQP